MKNAYIIFRNSKPQNNNEILELIVHFCREHNLSYYIPFNEECTVINIEGEDYYIRLQERQEEKDAAYWMIYCLLKSRGSLLKNIA